MGHAAIYIEDEENGGVAVRFDYTGGFNKESRAHIMSNKIREFLDHHPGLVSKQNEETELTHAPGTVTMDHPGVFPGCGLL